jgi:hypothetical protein
MSACVDLRSVKQQPNKPLLRKDGEEGRKKERYCGIVLQLAQIQQVQKEGSSTAANWPETISTHAVPTTEQEDMGTNNEGENEKWTKMNAPTSAQAFGTRKNLDLGGLLGEQRLCGSHDGGRRVVGPDTVAIFHQMAFY